MDADLDTLATALYVRPRPAEGLAAARRRGGRRWASPVAERRRAGHPGGDAGAAGVSPPRPAGCGTPARTCGTCSRTCPQPGYNKRLRGWPPR